MVSASTDERTGAALLWTVSMLKEAAWTTATAERARAPRMMYATENREVYLRLKRNEERHDWRSTPFNTDDKGRMGR